MTERRRPRIDYDQVAPLYDAQPFRAKDPDPDLRAFLAARPAGSITSVLDIGCGTGNQLVADATLSPSLRLTGADPFGGMLTQAAKKSRRIDWVRARGERLPFQGRRFDYVTHQFAFHHVEDKPALIREAFRVLRPGGVFVLSNISPDDMKTAAMYRFFPEVLEADLRHYPTREALVSMFRDAGFTAPDLETRHRLFDVHPSELLARFGQKQDCSQLIALDDASWKRGLAKVDALLQSGDAPVSDEVCLVKLMAVRPAA